MGIYPFMFSKYDDFKPIVAELVKVCCILFDNGAQLNIGNSKVTRSRMTGMPMHKYTAGHLNTIENMAPKANLV